MVVRVHPPGTPLPDDHPLKGTSVLFGIKRPNSSNGPSKAPTSSTSTETEEDGIRAGQLRLLKARHQSQAFTGQIPDSLQFSDGISSDNRSSWETILKTDTFDVGRKLLYWADLNAVWDKFDLGDHCDFIRHVAECCIHISIECEEWEADSPGQSFDRITVLTDNRDALKVEFRHHIASIIWRNRKHIQSVRLDKIREFHRDILEILAGNPGTGSYSQNVKLSTGENANYRPSWATGMASLASNANYMKHFGRKLPEWLTIEHPNHLSMICNKAVDQDIVLPSRKPISPAI